MTNQLAESRLMPVQVEVRYCIGPFSASLSKGPARFVQRAHHGRNEFVPTA
jgi:hypothetical protein